MGKRTKDAIEAFKRCDAPIDNYKHYHIGEKIIGNLYHDHDYTSKIRPFIIWGKYFNSDNKLIGLDLLPCSSKIKGNIGDFFFHARNFDQRSSKDTKGGTIVINNLFSLDIQQLDTKKYTNQILRPKFIPDIIARRVQSLVFSPHSRNPYTFDFNLVAHRVGFTFPLIQPSMIKSNNPSIDTSYYPNTEHIVHKLPTEIELTQDDINHICVWACLYSKHWQDNHLKITWPEPGTWPHWEPVPDGNGNMIPCVSPERKAQLLTELEIKPPVVTVTTKPNAAQKRLAGFGHFTAK